MLPKSWSIEKEKSPKLLSDSDLGDFSSGATGIRTRDTRIFSPLLYQLSYGTIVMSANFVLASAKIATFFYSANFYGKKLSKIFTKITPYLLISCKLIGYVVCALHT